MTWIPWRFMLMALAGWMNRQQQEVIAYLTEENRILREKLGHKRIILNDAQKRHLATAAMKLGWSTITRRALTRGWTTAGRWNRTRHRRGTGRSSAASAWAAC